MEISHGYYMFTPSINIIVVWLSAKVFVDISLRFTDCETFHLQTFMRHTQYNQSYMLKLL